MFRSSNPTLGRAFQNAPSYTSGETMTIQGTVGKTSILFLLVAISFGWAWNQLMGVAASEAMFETGVQASRGVSPVLMGAMMFSGIGGFIVAMVTIFKQSWAPVTAPIYAVLKGVALGAISAMFEMSYPGIATQAVVCTMAALGGMLAIYQTGFFKTQAGNTVMKVAGVAMFGIFGVYMINWIMSFFGSGIPVVSGNGAFGIGFSVIVVCVAALMLVRDFELIEEGSRRGAPKYMEWYAGFALLVTLVWLYLEILRLLAKLQSRR